MLSQGDCHMILDKVMKASALALIATPLSLLIPNISFAAPAGTTFECKELFGDASGSRFATYAVLSDGSRSLSPLLKWRTEQFSDAGYTPERRCYEVTNRLNVAVRQTGGSLAKLYLTMGYSVTGDSSQVICYVNGTSSGCNSSNILWTLSGENARNPAKVFAGLFNFITTAGSGSSIQESGGQPYVNLGELVDASFGNGTTPSSTPSAQPTQPFNKPATQPSPSQNGGI